MGISLKPSEATEGGGLLDDVQATIKSAKFEQWDYNGKVDYTIPALRLELVVDGEDEPHEQYYSMGSQKQFSASKDGKTLQAIGTAQTLNAGSNGMIFLGSLVNAGFPEDQMEDDITVLNGTVAHFIRQPAPKRGSINNKKEGDRESTILVVDAIISLPGEKPKKGAGGKSPAAKTGKGAAKKTADDEGATEQDAVDAIMEILAEKPDGVMKQALPALIFAKVKDKANKNDIIQLAFKGEFLGGDDRPWTYGDDGKITLG